MRLEPLGREHANELLVAARSEELWEWMWYDLREPDQLERWIGEALGAQERGEEYAFTVRLRQGGRAIGSTRYMDVQPTNRGLEIGWTWYARDVWGGVVNPECKYLLLRHAFEEWDALRVCLKTDNRNVHSQNAIQKLGAKYEGTLRSHRLRRDGTIRDSVMFSIIQSEWPAVKAALERRLGRAGSTPRSPR